MVDWSGGGYYEQRTAAAALCEPRLLKDVNTMGALLDLLDRVTAGLERSCRRQADDFRALRKALGYGWSVPWQPHRRLENHVWSAGHPAPTGMCAGWCAKT